MSDPSPELFRERMTPSPGVWVVGAVLGGAFGLILVPISLTAGAVTSVLMALAVCAALWASSPVITVDRHRMQLGRAAIPPTLLGEADVLDAERMRATMGVEIEPLAYRCTRGWIRTGVRIPVLDPEDPAPAWVATSRRPGELARALHSARTGA